MKKIIASALAATMLLANASVFAEYKTENKVLFTETFDTLTSNDDATGATVGGWRHETNNHGNIVGTQLTLTSESGMDKAAKFVGDGKVGFRGGIKLSDEQKIAPYEPYSIELDLYANADSKFNFCHWSENDHMNYPAEHSGSVGFWFTLRGGSDDENKTCFITYQQYDSGWYGNSGADKVKYTYRDADGNGLRFAYNEVNHIKVDYRYVNSKHTLTLTVKNSLGETTSVPAIVTCGKSDLDKGLEAITYCEEGKSATFCLDNIKLSIPVDTSVPEILEENGIAFNTDTATAYDKSNVSKNATSMTLNFDSDIKTVNSGAVKVTYGAGKSMPVTLSASGKAVTVKFDANLLPGFDYDVAIDSSKIIGASGNEMKADETFSFTVEDSAVDGEVVDGYVYDYYLNEDFSDYEYIPTSSATNNRKDYWGIESMNNENVSSLVTVETITDSLGNTMTDALRLAPSKNAELGNKMFRGGRIWDNAIGGEETFYVEYDIYAEDDADFSVGMYSSKALTSAYQAKLNPKEPENYTGRLFMRIQAQDADYSNSKIYYGGTQNLWCATNRGISGIEFKRNEVNHVKIEYTTNKNMTAGTTDTMTITVSNSAGANQSATITTSYRNENETGQGLGLANVSGITFEKRDNSSNVYLDNLKVYSMYQDVTPQVDKVEFIHEDGTEEQDVNSLKPDVTNIKLNFNTAMKYAVELLDLKTEDGKDVNYEASYEKGNSVINIALDDMLKPNETYVISVGKKATSKAGNKLSGDYTFSFKTTDGDIIIDDVQLSENADETSGSAKYAANTNIFKTESKKQQYALYLAAFDEKEHLIAMEYKTVTYDADDFGKMVLDPELTVADASKVKTIKAILCSYPSFRVIDVKTITK